MQAIPPLRDDGHGGLRVGRSRMSLDVVCRALRRGESVEEVVQAYDTLDPADVAAVVRICAEHAAEVEAYLARRRQEAEELRRQIESRPGYAEFHAKLLTRRTLKRDIPD